MSSWIFEFVFGAGFFSWIFELDFEQQEQTGQKGFAKEVPNCSKDPFKPGISFL